MKYKQKFTPHELMKKTVNDIAKLRQSREEGKRQAVMHSFENMGKIQRRISYGRY